MFTYKLSYCYIILRKSMFHLIFSIMLLFSVSNILCLSNKNDDKLLLSPVELIDLVREEQQKIRSPSIPDKYLASDDTYEEESIKDLSDPDQEELCGDAETLKNRKVWSRWSKWSECSVTCGGGVIARHRVCVAGRCAPGEREEQRRPCSRAPCLTPQYNITEEIREFD